MPHWRDRIIPMPLDGLDVEVLEAVIRSEGHEATEKRLELYAWAAFQRGLSVMREELEAQEED